MQSEDLHTWIETPELLSTVTLNQLEAAVSQYPYFQPLRFLYLKNLYLANSTQFYDELQRSAVYVSDRRRLFYYLAVIEGLWNDVFTHFSQKKEAPVIVEKQDVFSLIDSFLSDFAPEMLEPKPIPTHKAARIAMATQDYASLLVNEEVNSEEESDTQDVVKLKHHDLIDEFISFAGDGDSMRQKILAIDKDDPAIIPNLDVETDILNEEDLLTESLAKIYIKQKRYYKAIEIIRRLSLKYPEKSIYFADQIRFLEKLIINIKKE